MDSRSPLLAVDAPFLLYRSFFALPQTVKGVDGHPVGALLGAANVLLRVAAEWRPRAIVLCFGAESASYRVELYSAYHAHRPPVPPELRWQFEHAQELFQAFGWQSLASATLEADDLLGSLAAIETEAGGRTLLLTGDRDMYQCASPSTSVLYLRAGSSGAEEVGPDEVARRYGVPPALVADFIALRGDPSDGLPGAQGIGAKTAAALLTRHGSLEAVLAAAAGERPRIAAVLTESADELRAFRAIATLAHVELGRPADTATDLARGAAAARAFGMGALATRLEAAGSLDRLTP